MNRNSDTLKPIYLFLAVLGLWELGLLSSYDAWLSTVGAPRCGAWAVGCVGFSSCGIGAQKLRLPGSRAQAE